jgi:DnaK suppressor protein
MNKTELKHYREALDKKQLELLERIQNRDEIAIERAADVMDELKLAGERDFAIANLDRETSLLAEVRDALERIEDSSYGICVNCGRDIGQARLRAVPWAAYCVRCQDEVESKRGIQNASHEGVFREAA